MVKSGMSLAPTKLISFFASKIKKWKNKDQHALFIVDKHLEGIKLIDTPEFTHTFSHHHCIYNFNDVKIPSNCIIGKRR